MITIHINENKKVEIKHDGGVSLNDFAKLLLLLSEFGCKDFEIKGESDD